MPLDVAQIWIATLEAFVAGFLVGTFVIGKIWKSLKRNRRQRCLAMEHLCEVAAAYMRVKHDYDPVSECKAFYAHRAMWWRKWQNKWLALAEKYKGSE